MKKRTINVQNIYHFELQDIGNGHFLIEFHSQTHKMRVHLQDWFIGLLGREMHKHLKRREQEIENAKKQLRGDA